MTCGELVDKKLVAGSRQLTIAVRHADEDIALIRVEPPIEDAPMPDFLLGMPEIKEKVELRGILDRGPIGLVEQPVDLEVGSHDSTTNTFWCNSANVRGSSGGPVIWSGFVAGLASMRMTGEPISIMASTSKLESWLKSQHSAAKIAGLDELLQGFDVPSSQIPDDLVKKYDEILSRMNLPASERLFCVQELKNAKRQDALGLMRSSYRYLFADTTWIVNSASRLDPVKIFDHFVDLLSVLVHVAVKDEVVDRILRTQQEPYPVKNAGLTAFLQRREKALARIDPQARHDKKDPSLIGMAAERVIDINDDVVSLGLGPARNAELHQLLWAVILPKVQPAKALPDGSLAEDHRLQLQEAIETERESTGRIFLLTIVMAAGISADEGIRKIVHDFKIYFSPRSGVVDNSFEILWVKEGSLPTTLYKLLDNAKTALGL
jgi:hypothetical protein